MSTAGAVVVFADGRRLPKLGKEQSLSSVVGVAGLPPELLVQAVFERSQIRAAARRWGKGSALVAVMRSAGHILWGPGPPRVAPLSRWAEASPAIRGLFGFARPAPRDLPEDLDQDGQPLLPLLQPDPEGRGPDPYARFQGYLGSAGHWAQVHGPFEGQYIQSLPWGVGAVGLPSTAASHGNGARVVVLERGWEDRCCGGSRHPDLLGARLHRGWGVCSPRERDRRHGLKNLGILVAQHNQHHIRGIAPAAEVLLVSTMRDTTTWHPYQGLFEAILAAQPGDVLLVEESMWCCTAGAAGTPGRAPCNIEGPLSLDPLLGFLMAWAVGSGVTVVQAAGNGGHDLDTLEAPHMVEGMPVLDEDARPLLVTVAGVNPASGWRQGQVADGGVSGSNHGDGCDAFAWGRRVMTLDEGEGAQNGLTGGYTGTSPASAIIAGVAAVTQAMARDLLGAPLRPQVVRQLLVRGASPPAEGSDPVGVMPDLVAIRRALLEMSQDERQAVTVSTSERGRR